MSFTNTKSNLVTEWKWTSPSIVADELSEDANHPRSLELGHNALSIKENRFRVRESSNGADSYDRPVPKNSYMLETIFMRRSLKKRKTPLHNSIFHERKQKLYKKINLKEVLYDKLSKSEELRKRTMPAGASKDSDVTDNSRRENQCLLEDRLRGRGKLRRDACQLEQLNEIFAEKFYLTNWNEYFGRTVIAFAYLYLLVSLIMLGISIGLYATIIPSYTPSIVPYDQERKQMWYFLVILCSCANLVNSLFTYSIVMWNSRGLVDYVIHFLGLLIVSVIGIAFMSSSDSLTSRPTERDFQSFFIASSMYEDDPEYFESVWPNLDPSTLLNIQNHHSCCGYSSVEDWRNLLDYEEKRRKDKLLPPSKITIPPSCCVKDKILPSTSPDYCLTSGYPRPCEQFLKQDLVQYESWNLQIFCGAFAFLLTINLIGLSYFLSMYMREVSTWDGEVRMKIFRDSHKSYLGYMLRLTNFHLFNLLCCCYVGQSHFKRVHPLQRRPPTPPKLVTGTGTHFEVWHTPSGEVINVVEVSPDKIVEQTNTENDMAEYLDNYNA